MSLMTGSQLYPRMLLVLVIERRSRYVTFTWQQNFWMIKPKTSLKSEFALFQTSLILFHLICQMLAKFSGLNPKGPYLSLEKERETFCVVFTYSVKQVHEIRKFHVAIVQRWLKNVQKSVMHVSSCVVLLI